MIRMTSTVTYKVPRGLYCNHKMKKSTPLTRCRFCTEIYKGNFVCVLHNEPLNVLNGILIQKTPACLSKCKVVDDVPEVPMEDLVKYVLSEYRKIYNGLRSNGIPEKLADEVAQKEVLACISQEVLNNG